MNMVLAVAVGGAAGAVGRHYVNVLAAGLLGHGFPWGTLTVNVLGSLAMGILVHVLASGWDASPEMRALLTVGGLGAFTTFSAFSLDAVVLCERGQVALAAAYVAASVAMSVGALLVGLRLGRLVLA